MLRDQAPAPALTPGTGVTPPKPTGDHGSGDPAHFYHPGDPSSFPPPPGTGVPPPKPTGDIHHPGDSPPPPPHDGRPLSSIPPGPVPTGVQGSGKQIGVSGSGNHSTVPKQVANTPRDANDILPPPGAVIPKPIPTGPVVPPPAPPPGPKDVKLAPIAPVPNDKAPRDNAPPPAPGIPKPAPTDPSALPPPVSGPPKDPKSPILPSPLPINKAPNDIPPIPTNGTPKPVPVSHPADGAPVPKPVSGTLKDATLTP